MFLCERDILLNEPRHNSEVFNYLQDYWKHNGKEVNNNFSHDNLTLVACWCKLFAPKWLKKVPLFGRHTWRPDNFFFFLYVKFRPLGAIFLPLLSLLMVISMLRVWRTNSRGQKELSTSGKIISFFKCISFDLKITKKVLDYIVKKHPDLKTWLNIFDIYFNPENNNNYVYDAFVISRYR